VSSAPRIDVLAGAGGVGKTTVAATTALALADAGRRTLVMTFDPSRRLKDALGIGERAAAAVVEVAGSDGRLYASLLDARATFDGLIERYAPDDAVRQRILGNRYYTHLAGSLAGILEYMAVEKLYEVARGGDFDRIVLDTPPISQALDLLEAPRRIVAFLDSGAVRLATRDWFSADGHLRAAGRFGSLGRRFERYLDDLVGLELLRDLVEFFTAFKPLFQGFRARAAEVEDLLRSPATRFSLVTTASADRTHDTLYFARRLLEAGLHLDSVVINRRHAQPTGADPRGHPLARLARAVAAREQAAVESIVDLLGGSVAVEGLPDLGDEPVDLAGLRRLAALRRDA
jgi:anion-transporting  ArsA/GET3 family ATPase